jgi:positive regulator of sigma E activity
MVIVVASLSFQLLLTLNKFGINGSNKGNLAVLVIADIIAITGAFWLIRSYRRTLRLLKKQEQDKINKENLEKGKYNE